jgi:hypothetical protein
MYGQPAARTDHVTIHIPVLSNNQLVSLAPF